MHFLNLSITLLGFLAIVAMAQILSTPGFTTTSLFMPGATFTPYITSLGSGDGTTTWGAANSSKGLETPYLLVTLGPTSMLFSMTNTQTKSTDTVNNIIFSTLAITSNCSYTTFPTATPSSASATQTGTAKCTEISNWIASNAASATFKYTDLPEAIPSQVPSGFDGYNAVYVKAISTEMSTVLGTSTSPGAAAATDVGGWARGAAFVAAGAAALIV